MIRYKYVHAPPNTHSSPPTQLSLFPCQSRKPALPHANRSSFTTTPPRYHTELLSKDPLFKKRMSLPWRLRVVIRGLCLEEATYATLCRERKHFSVLLVAWSNKSQLQLRDYQTLFKHHFIRAKQHQKAQMFVLHHILLLCSTYPDITATSCALVWQPAISLVHELGNLQLSCCQIWTTVTMWSVKVGCQL